MAHGPRPDIDRYLRHLWEVDGTDLLLTAGSPPLARVDGRLQPVEDGAPLGGDDIGALVDDVLTADQRGEFERRRTVDFSFSWGDTARIRGNAFHQRGSVALVLRVIPFEIPSFEELGLPPVTKDLVARPQGLILVTGPTGSGKSTTLAAMIDHINTHRPVHILTIEDPIEYLHHHKRGAVNQREVGIDAHTFADALRSALREDPDVLLVGEMRDLESIQFALTIAETGHLVLATLHTNDTAQALDRIIDVFPAERQTQIRVQLANSLAAIYHQRLLPAKGGGRVAAFEVLLATPPVRNLVREGKTAQLRNQLVTGQKEGMQTLESSLSALIGAGRITYEDAVARSLHPGDIVRP